MLGLFDFGSKETPFRAALALGFLAFCSFLWPSRICVKCCTANSTKSGGLRRSTSTVYPCSSSFKPAGISTALILYVQRSTVSVWWFTIAQHRIYQDIHIWDGRSSVWTVIVTGADWQQLLYPLSPQQQLYWFIYLAQPVGKYWPGHHIRCNYRVWWDRTWMMWHCEEAEACNQTCVCYVGHDKLKQIHQKAVFNPNYESIPEMRETKVIWNGKEMNVYFIQV